MQVTQVFDYLAQGEGGKKVHVSVPTRKLQTDELVGEDSELERLESDERDKKGENKARTLKEKIE